MVQSKKTTINFSVCYFEEMVVYKLDRPVEYQGGQRNKINTSLRKVPLSAHKLDQFKVCFHSCVTPQKTIARFHRAWGSSSRYCNCFNNGLNIADSGLDGRYADALVRLNKQFTCIRRRKRISRLSLGLSTQVLKATGYLANWSRDLAYAQSSLSKALSSRTSKARL